MTAMNCQICFDKNAVAEVARLREKPEFLQILYWVVRCCNSKNDFLNDLGLLYFGEKRKQSLRSQRLLCNLCKNQRTTSS